MHGQHRAKELRVDNGHVLARAFDDGGFKEQTRPRKAAPAAKKRAPLLNGQGHLPLNMFNLPKRAQRAHFCRIGLGISNHDAAGDAEHARQEVICDIIMQIKPRTRDTGLTAGREYPSDRTIHSALDIGIVKDNDWRLAPQFQTHLRKIFRRILDHLCRSRRPARERDAGHFRMTG